MFFTRPARRKSSACVSKTDHARRRKLFFEPLEDRRVLAADFNILTLTANNVTAVEHNTVTGDDRGGIAVSSSQVFVTGDGPSGFSQTARFSAANLSGAASIAGVGYDALTSDLATETVYSLGINATTPLTNVFFSPLGLVNVTHLLQVNGSTGALTGNAIAFSTPITVNFTTGAPQTGIFAGYGRVVLHTPNNNTAYEISLPSGTVTSLGSLAPPPHTSTESWAYWGVAEHFGGADYLAFAQNPNILRTRVSDSATSIVAAFSNLSDMASFTVSPSLNRWYFHHEGTSQFRSGDETVGFADATFSIAAAASSSIGVSIDDSGERLLIFNPVTGTQTGLVNIPSSDPHLDTVISPDGKLAYVSSFTAQQIYVVDLTTMALASGTNPINTATEAEDLVITTDGKYLLVVDGGNTNPIVVVDTATRATVFVLNEGISHSGIDVTPSGDVLVGSLSTGTTRRYTINGAGAMTFTGQQIGGGGQNVIAAPNGIAAIETNGGSITSFLISGMVGVSGVTPGGTIMNMTFSPDGSKFYVRTANNVIAYNYNQTTGIIGSQLFNVGGFSTAIQYFGVDQLDITPDGARIYVSSGNQVVALNALTGANLGNISLAGAQFVGVDIAGTQGNNVVADANGPYSINEGQSLNLDATGSTASASATYEWDVDGDGDYDENITGKTVTVTWVQLQGLGIADGPHTNNMTVRVTDVGGGSPVTTELLTNGSFETGNFTGWTVTNQASPYIINPTVLPTGANPVGFFAVTPTNGNFAVQDGFDGGGPGAMRLAQVVAIPAGSIDTLTFDWRASWNHSSQARTLRVNIETVGGTLLSSTLIYSTTPPGSFDTGNQTATVNLTAFAGQTVRVAIDQYIPENFTGPAQMQIDNVRLQSTSGGGGGSDTDTTTLTINNVSPTITSFITPSLVLVGTPISLSAAATDPAGAADPLTFIWTITRPDLSTFTLGGTSPSFIPTQQGSYGVSLVVDDGDLGTATASASINVAGTLVTLSGSDLLIRDNLAGGKNDDLHVSYDPANDWFDIVDPVNLLFVDPLVGTQVDAHHVRVPRGNFGGNVLVNTLDGDDLLTVDSSMVAGGRQVIYSGGNPTVGPSGDAMVLSGPGTFTTITHSFANAADGTVDIDGYPVAYFGLEPIADNLNAVNRVFTFLGGPEIVTLANSGGAADTVSTISSTLAESVAFVNPTGSLTINLNGGDTFNFNSLDSLEGGGGPFNANLIINGLGGDTVNFPTSMINLGAGNANIGTTGGLPIQNINFTGGGIQTTGSVFLTGTGSITNVGVPIEIVALNLVAVAPITVDLDTNVFNVEIQGGSGGVTIDEFDALNVGGIGAVNGISSTSGNISVIANGTITVNEPVSSTGGGSVTVTANGSLGGATYYPSGPQTNVAAATLVGWTPFYVATMDQILPVGQAALMALSSKPYWMMAGRVTGSSTYLVLAAAPKADVFFNVPANNTTHNANGSEWYYTDDYSWGFANGGDTVSRSSADTSGVNGNLRMSLHTHNYVGGWRIGTNTSLNSSNAFEKVLLGADSIGGGTPTDVVVNANISTTGGNGAVTVSASQDILHNSGTISAAGNGTVTESAGRHVTMGATTQVQSNAGNVAITADNAAGNNGGAITMANGSLVNTNALASLTADGNIQLSLVQTTSAAGNAVTVTSTSGAITDADGGAALDISAVNGGAILSAATGVGAATSGPTIEVQVINLDVHNNTSGGIFVTDTAGGLTLTNLSGPTSVSGIGGNGLITALSPLTIAASAITAGGMTYTATDGGGAGDNLLILPGVAVTDTTASLTFNAGDDFILTNTASISAATTATINIDFGNADGGAGAVANIFGALAAPGGASMNGAADSDTFNVTGPTATALDGITAAVTIDGFGGVNTLNLNDSLDVSGDTASITHTTVEGLGGSPGIDYTYSNIAILDVTATSAADILTTSLGGPVASPTSFNGLVSVFVRGNGGADNMFLHVADSLTNASLDFVRLFGDAGGDNFGGAAAADHIRPVLATGQTQIIINGDAEAKLGPGPVNPGTTGTLTGPDRLFVDMTTTDSGAVVLPVVIVDTNGGYADAANTVSFRYNGIEDIDLYDGGVLTDTAIGDFFVRATDNADYIEFRSAAQVDPVFRVRVGNIYYPTTGGNYGPYTTATSNVFVYGRGGNDTITMYNTRLNGAIFGEAGDDILTGGYGNDLLVGGTGNDRINGGAVGGNDEVWGDDYNPATDDPAVASQTGTGNDQINTFGGSDTVYGQGGNDIINTGLGADYINGGPGNDLLDGQGGDDRIYAGTGNDTASGSDGNDIVAGNDGDDTLLGRTGDDILIGGLGIDMVNGHEGGDVVVGDQSNNAGGSDSLAKGDAADAALLALMAAWGPPGVKSLALLGAFGSAGTDGSIDTLWGGSEADAFFATGPDVVADRVVGTDLN